MSQDLNQKEPSPGILFLGVIYKNRFLITIFVLILTILSGIYAFKIAEPEYKSSANLVPPQQGLSSIEGSISSLGSALKDFGLQSLGGGEMEGFSYKVILFSRSVKDSIIYKYKLGEVYDIPDTQMRDIRKEFDGKHEIVVAKDGNYEISVWDVDKQRACDMANDFAKIANSVALRVNREEANFNLSYMEKRLDLINQGLASISDTLKIFAKQYGMYFPEEQAKGIAEVIADLKAKEFQLDMMVSMREEFYGKDDYKTQINKKLLDEIRKKIKDAETNPGLAGNFSLKDAADVTTDYARLYVEYETYSKVKAILIPTLEKARLETRRNIKNLYVLDEAIPAEKKDRPKRSIIVAGTFVGSFVLSVFIIVLYDSFRRFKREFKEYEI